MIAPWDGGEEARRQITDIFWETAGRTEFPDEAVRTHFRRRYLDVYLDGFAELVLLAWQGERVLGYILGVADTLAARETWEGSPHLALFEDMYKRYPAHLHINCRGEARGMGVGSELLREFEQRLALRGLGGVHLITASTARNVGFYLKNGYHHRVERLWEGRPLLLLGKTISDNA